MKKPVQLRTIKERGTLYAYEGELVYCRGGHPLASLARTVCVGDEIRSTDFRYPIEGLAPESTGCPICGEDTNGWGTYFFKD